MTSTFVAGCRALTSHRALDANAGFLQKPFMPAALAHKVREVLDGATTASVP
jgi:hypothetical protein